MRGLFWCALSKQGSVCINPSLLLAVVRHHVEPRAGVKRKPGNEETMKSKECHVLPYETTTKRHD